MPELFRCARALAGGCERRDFAFVCGDDGFVADAGDFASLRERYAALPERAFPADRLVVPGFVNGHSHGYQVLLRGWADDWGFERWRSEALYRVLPALGAEDVYWVFVAAFSEMLAAGITTVAEFFYLNGGGNERAEAMLRAARRTGIRVVLARTWMDAPAAPPQFRESIDEAVERTLALRAAYPQARVCVAPHSLHGASEAMLRAAAAFARQNDCDLHVHVAETRDEVAFAQQLYGSTPLTVLERLGILGSRTVAVHAIHASEEEKDAVARSGTRVVANPSTNAYLGDGVVDIVGFRRRGVCVGLGTDANVKPSIVDEMRTALLQQKVAALDGSVARGDDAFALGTSAGAAALGVPAGDLEPGRWADFSVLDAAAIDPWSPAINALVYRGESRWVQAAFVGGRRVYTGEPSELAAEARAEVSKIAARCV